MDMLGIGKHCKKYSKMAREHPASSALIGLGLGLALALGLGKWLGETGKDGHAPGTGSAFFGSDAAPRSRSGMHGQDLLKKAPCCPSGTAIGLTLGGAALLVGGLLLSGRSQTTK